MSLNVLDIASYQAGINVKATGADGVIVKVSEGTNYLNPARADQIRQTINANRMLGLYHFLHRGNAKQQAQYFLNNIKGYIGSAILALDVEGYNNNTQHATPANAKQFMDYVYQQTGVRMLLYTNISDINIYDYSAIAKANYGLWLAQYDDTNKHIGFQPKEIYGKVRFWSTVALHQYSSTTILPGWDKHLDVSIFNGDKKAWLAYAKGNTKTQTPTTTTAKPAPKPTVNKVKSWTDSLGVKWYAEKAIFKLNTPIKLRWGATTQSKVIALLNAGSTVNYDAYAFANGHVWLRQPRGKGQYGYIASGECRKGKRTSSWGTFK